jgi:HPr kinase/phosphorylase
MSSITIEEMLSDQSAGLELELVAGREGIKKKITTTNINRPGLALAGYFEYFGHKRVQVLGKGEISYLLQLPPEKKREILDKLFQYEITCFIVAWGQEIPPELIEYAEKHKTVILRTPLSTARLTTALTLYLEDKFAPEVSMHGDLVDVYGVGVLILGRSGVGKSECALDLVEKGHRLIADDVVTIKRKRGVLIGTSAELIKYHMEIRGLGIIDIKSLFGTKAICSEKEVELAVNLEEWRSDKEYDRLGLEESAINILDIEIPYLIIPVRPGRNITVIVEVAAMNHRLKQMGYYSAREFSKELLDWMRESR